MVYQQQCTHTLILSLTCNVLCFPQLVYTLYLCISSLCGSFFHFVLCLLFWRACPQQLPQLVPPVLTYSERRPGGTLWGETVRGRSWGEEKELCGVSDRRASLPVDCCMECIGKCNTATEISGVSSKYFGTIFDCP